jgi:REP element-mobilizing transposase RayT
VQTFGTELVDLDGQDDHVHRLVASPPQGASRSPAC